MDSCQYVAVPTADQPRRGLASRTTFLRQLVISFAIWLTFFMTGLVIGAPTVIIPQLRKEANSTEAVSEEMASWMSAAVTMGAIPFDIISAVTASFFGRKPASAFVCVVGMVTFIYVSVYGATVVELFVSLCLIGSLNSFVSVLGLLILTEYNSPKYRGAFLTTKSASYIWGIWVSNAIGTFFHWKFIFYLGSFCSVIALVLFTLSSESPYWLAGQGRRDECETTFRWLRGVDQKSEKELETLLKSVKAKSSIRSKFTMKFIKKYARGFKTKEFLKPSLISLIFIVLYLGTGKFVCMIYAIDIIKKITSSEHTAYLGMLVLDGVTVFGMYAGSALSACVKRRTLLFTTSLTGVLFLLLLSLYLYLVKSSIVTGNAYVSVILLMMFSLGVSSGPLTLCSTFRGELLPFKNRTGAILIQGILSEVVSSALVKTFPYLYRALDMHGAFLFFAVVTVLTLILVYKYAPETKDKTLHEISDAIKGDDTTTETRRDLSIKQFFVEK